MNDRPLLIVSDIHLGAVPATTERAFRRFLAFAADTASALLINGDLFDFWFEYRSVVLRDHYRVLASLAEVVENGLKVWFVGGNHDAWGGSFLRDEVGVDLVVGPVEMDLAGRRTLVAHGDGVGRGDLKYRAMKACIRHPAVVGMFRQLHPDWGSWIAGKVSTTDAKSQFSDETAAGRARYIHAWAVETLLARPELDLVTAGHSHVPLVEEVAPGRFYANSGDWIHHRSYLELGPGGGPPVLRSWEES
jgi:UDP-2,3-diacylglucosamine hydrolase